MIFPYVKVVDFPNHKKRENVLPWIRFGLFNPNNKSNMLYALGLVDSGSELTFVDHEIGEALGFDIKSGSKVEVTGVGGGKIIVYLHKVGLTIGDADKRNVLSVEDFIAFSYNKFPSSMPQQTAILGTVGFFRNFCVTFNFPDYISIDKLKIAN
ncbi:MAG: hypothetical protein HYW86_00525 [Candidatus Roizmanbacteria bacterium]|nr:MAG: hypothetical protein HYW86_00525 [Candidatus Roizmanbacteria bacterium]